MFGSEEANGEGAMEPRSEEAKSEAAKSEEAVLRKCGQGLIHTTSPPSRARAAYPPRRPGFHPSANQKSEPPMLPNHLITHYREHGFVHVPGIITQAEAARFHDAALDATTRLNGPDQGGIFHQTVNAWLGHDAMRELTLHPGVARAAEQLAGVSLRLWHDHILIKQPGRGRPTEYHQDQPYWPHADSRHPVSAWIALCDVPVEKGCMSFIHGSHRKTDLPMQHLTDPRSLMTLCPELVWSPRTTAPLRAGDCTFHHGRCAHMAGPNDTQSPRVAHVIIFMDATTTYTGLKHPVTDPLNLTVGSRIEGKWFPTVREILAKR